MKFLSVSLTSPKRKIFFWLRVTHLYQDKKLIYTKYILFVVTCTEFFVAPRIPSTVAGLHAVLRAPIYQCSPYPVFCGTLKETEYSPNCALGLRRRIRRLTRTFSVGLYFSTNYFITFLLIFDSLVTVIFRRHFLWFWNIIYIENYLKVLLYKYKEQYKSETKIIEKL